MNIQSRFDRWIFGSWYATPKILAGIRIFYAGFILFFLNERVDWIASFPKVFYHPPLSLAMLTETFPPEWFFHTIHVIVIISLVSLLLGYKTKTASIIVTLVSIIYTTYANCFGNILHSTLVLTVPLVMAFSNWGAAWSVDAHRNDHGKQKVETWPLTLMCVIFGFCMFTAGIWKFEWSDLQTSGVQTNLFANFYARDRADLLAPIMVGFNQFWFWEMMDWVTLIFELAFLPLVFFPTLYRINVLIAFVFHLIILLILNVDFSALLMVYILFLFWKEIRIIILEYLPGLVNALDTLFGSLRAWMIIPTSAILLFLLYMGDNPYRLIQELTGYPGQWFLGISLLLIFILVDKAGFLLFVKRYISGESR